MRLFIAIEIPDDLKKQISCLQVEIPGARWVPAEQIHLTLAFLGEVEESVVEPLNTELALIPRHEFKLCFSGTGCFPKCHRPRVLWIGVELNPRLNELAALVHKAVRVCGIPQEDRRFSPHITLARLKLPESRQSDAFLDRHEKLKFTPFPVREFTLFQSRLTQQGAVHIPLKSFPLTPADARGEG